MRQMTDYTCGPTTLRICVNAFLRTTLSSKTARHLCKTTTDGTAWHNLKLAYKKAGLKIFNVTKYSQKEWDSWLDNGYFIVAADEDTYANSHVIVVYKNGSLRNYGILDPAVGIPVTKNKSEVIKSSKREAFAVCAA